MSFRRIAKLLGRLLGLCLLHLTVQASPRTAFVQLFEWPWKDVARECETYLGPAGFAAVQISPPQEHIHWTNNPWWERYQVVSYKLNSRGGDEADFADMVQRCRQAGVDVYVDAVLNHMTGIPGGLGSAASPFTHYEYPGLFSFADFHHCGRNGNDNISRFEDRYELQNCELLDLADLATENEKVRETLAAYLNHLLDLGVAGFRIDAAKHIPAADLAAIFAKLKRSSYIYQEIIYDSQGPIQYSEYLPLGDVMAYDYPYVLARGFRDKKALMLKQIAEGFPSSRDAVVFVTNHDLERSGTALSINSELRLYRLAQIFMLAWPYGYPQIYSGYQFSDKEAGPPLNAAFKTLSVVDATNACKSPWTCEHRLPEVAAMVDFRNHTDRAFQVDQWWSNGEDLLAFSRGSYGFVAINLSTRAIVRNFATTLQAGSYRNILEENGLANFNVQHGSVTVSIEPESAVVLLRK